MASSRQKVAVISGGASGIGLALARQLAGEGYRVITCGRDRARLEAFERELPGATGLVCDVADRAAVRAFAAEVLKTHPAIDLLVPNAGVFQLVDFNDDLAEVDLGLELRVNVEGVMNLVAAFVPALKAAAPAAILVVGSGYGLAPTARAPVYSASKAAVHSLCIALRHQLAPHRVSVTELLPPLTDTPMVAAAKGKKLSAETVAALGLKGVQKGVPAVYPGQVAMMPPMLRLMPGTFAKIVLKT